VKKQGFGLVEAMVAVAIISASFLALTGVNHTSLKLSREVGRATQAAFLLQEGVEAARVMRDRSWRNEILPLSATDTYSPEFRNGSWYATTSTTTLIDNLFQRTFIFNSVYRDTNDDIADSGTLDPETRKLTVTVAWGSVSKSISTYVTDLFNN